MKWGVKKRTLIAPVLMGSTMCALRRRSIKKRDHSGCDEQGLLQPPSLPQLRAHAPNLCLALGERGAAGVH